MVQRPCKHHNLVVPSPFMVALELSHVFLSYRSFISLCLFGTYLFILSSKTLQYKKSAISGVISLLCFIFGYISFVWFLLSYGLEKNRNGRLVNPFVIFGVQSVMKSHHQRTDR